MYEIPTCARCEGEYALRDGEEPSKYCDPCAQERVVELEELVNRISHWPCEEPAQTSGCECASCLCRQSMKGLEVLAD
jgi:PHP family Zn ribbon phosphoesterase